MNIYEYLVKNLFFPMWMKRGGNFDVLGIIRKVGALNYSNADKIADRQLSSLKKIITYAYTNTTYYKELLDQNGISPSDIQTVEDIRRIPILTKRIIRSRSQELVSQAIPAEALLQASTGGSTGVPMQFFRDRECIHRRKAQELFFDKWYGYNIGVKSALFVSTSHHESELHKLKARIRNATCERLLRFDPSSVDDVYLDDFYEEFRQYKPKFIKSFPNSLMIFAEYLNRTGKYVEGIEAITCTGENLYKYQKDLFESVFQAPVYEKYGTKESGVIAAECLKRQGLHVYSDGVYVELLNEKGESVREGEMGRIVITDLFNKAMPMIRYEIGDLAICGGNGICECGVALPVLRQILGRDRDILLDESNNPKPGYLFVEVVNKANLDVKFQIVQKSDMSIYVYYEGERLAKSVEEMLRIKFKSIVGDKIEVSLLQVDEIELDKSGKYRYVKSEMTNKWKQ